MNRVFSYSLRLLLPVFVSMTSSLHAAEPEEAPAVDVEGILAARQAAVAAVISQKKIFQASNADPGDYFQAVAVSGDTVVVGAPFEDSNAKGVNGNRSNNALVHSGAAYVYIRSGDKWVQQAYLKASNPGKNDQFGFSVAISGNTIVVGAFGEDSKSSSSQTDNTAVDAGAAYVFTRTGTVWTQQAYLKSSTAAAGNLFGYSVAISKDSIVVGAMAESAAAASTDTAAAAAGTERAGAAYVFTRSTTTWTQQASLKASNPGMGDLFGISVGISGNTVVVGAQNESSDSTGVNGFEGDDTQSSSGAAYVFVRSGSAWTKQAYLKASNTSKNDLFGHSVAISGRTIVVGAHQESSKARGVNKNQSDNSAAKSGAAYVFIRDGKKWQQQAYLKASNTGAGDNFGYSVAISGASVLVGSYGEDSNARGLQGNQVNNSNTDSGAAYLFTRSGSKWSQKSYLKASNSASNDRFGKYVAIDEDAAVVSGPGFAKSAGAAYLFESDLSPRPEIAVESQAGANLLNGSATVDFGNFKIGDTTADKKTQTFTIRNKGTKSLTGVAVTKSGADSANYTVNDKTIDPSIAPGGSTTFSVTFADKGITSATRAAALTIKSSDLDEPEFKILLSGQFLSTTADQDKDGMFDYAEAQYQALGFDWKTNNKALVDTLIGEANNAGLFTTTDVQTAVKVTTPVLTKNATTGEFTLTIAVAKSTDLKIYEALKMSDASTDFTTDGELKFKFTPTGNATFYRVLAK